MMTRIFAPRRGRALVRVAALVGSALLAACETAPTAPASGSSAAPAARADTAARLAPTNGALTGRSGFMLSSGRGNNDQ